ncbi:hypothetical protein KR018_001393, partial [Drosophila ironensis]
MRRLDSTALSISVWILLIIGDACYEASLVARTVGRKGNLRYEPAFLTVKQMKTFANLSDSEDLRRTVLSISVERVPGTQGHTVVRDFIRNSLLELNWKVELGTFTNEVPILGAVTFHNIIARHNPHAKRFLMLGCHYDSKYFKEFKFVGATDSAVSCALLLNMAKVLRNHLHRSDISLMFVFFDGEEAFGDWSDKDSLYGSKNLAALWAEQRLLDRIDLFLLLDLIGAPDISFNSLVPRTFNWYQRLVQLEDELTNEGILGTGRSVFKLSTDDDQADDHIPFQRRQVPVIHLIAADYPAVWHMAADVEERVDYNSTEQVALVLRMFVMEYLLSAPAFSGTYW